MGPPSLELYNLVLLQQEQGSWVYPAERTAGAVDPLNLIQTMLAEEQEVLSVSG
jgi:hypothetical protein